MCKVSYPCCMFSLPVHVAISAMQVCKHSTVQFRVYFRQAKWSFSPLLNLFSCVEQYGILPEKESWERKERQRFSRKNINIKTWFRSLVERWEALAMDKRCRWPSNLLSLREAWQKAEEIGWLKVVYCSEVEQLKLQVGDLNFQNQLLV